MKKNIANWGNFPEMETEEQKFTLTRQLKQIILESDHIIARGNGRCYGDASLATITASTIKYDKVLSFDIEQGILNCQSGITLDQILKLIVPKGWFLPVTPGTQFITLGGAVSSDVHGKNHHIDGSFSRHIQEMDVLIANGTVVTCSQEINTDLFWSTCGGMGLTGMITRVQFRLKKIETAFIRQKQVKAANLEEVLVLFEKYKDYTYSVAWIDCLKKGRNFGRSILILGEHALPEELSPEQKKNTLLVPEKKGIAVPFMFPGFLLNNFTVKAFNALYYAKNLKKEIDNIVHYKPFFYPLDVLRNWNRIYGKEGFVQYQFVLPMESKEGLITILKKISEKGLGSFLAVLKVFGEQDDLISFPTKGYTLALDFPVKKGLFEFLDELDSIVLQYGGRLYLSKDARMKAETFWKSYKNALEFQAIMNKFDPHQKFSSLQSKRLGLTSI